MTPDRWYDAVARMLGAEPAPLERCQRLMGERFRKSLEPLNAGRRIAIGHGCSDFAPERMLNYGRAPCSPCMHIAGEPPCRGNNVCIRSLFEQAKEYETLSWIV